MARGLSRRSRHMIIFFITALIYACSAETSNQPEFDLLTVLNVSEYKNENVIYKKVEFEVRGTNLYSGMQIKTTKTKADRNTICREDLTTIKIKELKTFNNIAIYVMHLPQTVHEKVYFCLPRVAVNDEIITPGYLFDTWYHQGNVSLNTNSYRNENHGSDLGQVNKQYVFSRRRRDDSINGIQVTGLRVDVAPKEPHLDENGVPFLLAGSTYTLRLFGKGFSKQMLITFTQEKGKLGGTCQIPGTPVYHVIEDSLGNGTVQVKVKLPVDDTHQLFYICIKEENNTTASEKAIFIHQGINEWTAIRSFEKMVPLWLAIVIICVCLCFSALFSGLNLGLMSLDRTELKILCNTGTMKEREYAKKIQPVRNHGNFLLCSILLGNVLVNSTFTILLDDLTSGVIAIVCSTLSIVMFGEITPQAICSRHGLAIGAKTIYVTKLVMAVTFPLSYPISKVLDVLLGEEIGSVYTRERLKELVKVTTGENDLDREEINIISGALELRKKTVADVMTKIEDTFMLDYDATLDFETVSEIMKSGYSRIPVFENDRKNIITTLYIKDLAFVDPDDNTPLKTLSQFYQNPCNFVFEDVTLDVMFKDFKDGNKGHMAFINRVNNEGEGDPFYETIGLITLEDVIEELIQAEIMDETDVFTDNRTKRRRNADRTKQDFTVFAERRGENNRIRISPQLTLATFQYLSTSVDLFKPESISETILRRLLKQDIIYHIKKNKDWKNDATTIIYEQGKAVDYFVLILEGRVEVTVGQENLMFESGAFTYFGTQALQQNVGIAVESPTALGSLQSLNMDNMLRYTFQPDYSVRGCSEVLYMKVRRNLYMAAKRASLMERSKRDNNTNSGDQFDDEVEKLLHSLEDDGSIGRNTPERNRTISDYMTDVTYYNGGGCGDCGNQAVDIEAIETIPRTPSVKSHTSPTSTRQYGSREINGSVKYPNPIDIEVIGQEEEVSLLSKKS